jgi:pimeloyl-ACP methyl ester carboxylesterase
LAVAIFHPPGGAAKPDPIIYLQGGPGASALELLYLSFDRLFVPVLAAGRDLILFDQRGVGRSQPALDCPQASDLGLELLDHELDGQVLTDAEMDELLREAYRACAQELSAVADLAAYHTLASAADVNDLRLALGYDRVNLWGASYGTRLALEVMRDYPAGVRSVVLDSVYPPDVDMYLEAPGNLDRALGLLFDACAADAACNAPFPDLRQRFLDTLARLDAAPAHTVVTNPLTRESHAAVLTGDAMFGVVFQLLYDAEALPVLPQLIDDASRGDLGALSRIYGALVAQRTVSSPGMSFSVQCHDEITFSSLEQLEAGLARYPDLAPYMRETMLGVPAYDVCTYWPAGHAAPAENEPVSSGIPSLVMQGEHDPITPPAWGRHAAETLANAYLFVYPAVAHGAITSECARTMMLAFLNNPQAAPPDACLGAMGGLPFVVPATAEEVIEMVPFDSGPRGVRGVVPAGWREAEPGVYVRGRSALDETVLAMDSHGDRAQAVLRGAAQRVGFDPALQPVAREACGHFTWDFYSTQAQGLAVDLALAEERSRSFVVLLVAEPEERDMLYAQVFRPAVEALALGSEE